MEHWRKIWTDELNEWLIKNKEIDKKTRYELFIKTFKNTGITFGAFTNQCSRIKAIPAKYAVSRQHKGGRKKCEIGSIHFKKGYMKRKIAQPNVWQFEHHRIWDLHNPNNKVKPAEETVIFLNGNNRDFRIENLYKTTRAVMGVFNQKGGLVKTDADKTLINLKHAELYLQLHIRARHLGITSSTGRLKSSVNAASKRYLERLKKDPEKYKEYLKKASERAKKRLLELKKNPEKYNAFRQRRNELSKRWRERKKINDIKNKRR